MNWHDEAILLNLKRFSDKAYIATFFTPSKGVAKGFVREKKDLALLEGDIYFIRWKARLAEQLGTFQVERFSSSFQGSNFLHSPFLYLLRSACDLCFSCLAPLHVYDILYEALEELVTLIKNEASGELIFKTYCSFEVLFLQELGYGLDLSRCAATQKTTNLYYLSPKTGRAICQEEGKAYDDRLFKIPPFWLKEEVISQEDIKNSLTITDYFLKKHLIGKSFSHLNREFVFKLALRRQKSCA